MDATTERLIDYAMSVGYPDLPPSTVEACKRRMLDTLGCVAAAYDHPVSIAARKLAEAYAMDRPATVLGGRTQTAPEMAAFANGVMLRVLDLNDMYRLRSGGHPSDIIAAALAAAELGSRDGKSLVAAIATGYEVYCSCCDGFDLNSRGWDQPVYGVVAAFLAAGKLLGLDRRQLGHGLALALVPNMALFATRQGELSSWKGCAAANHRTHAPEVLSDLLPRAIGGVGGPRHARRASHRRYRGRPHRDVPDGSADNGERSIALGAQNARNGRSQPALRRLYGPARWHGGAGVV
jgi:2-methylcitrate dehydratase